MWVWSHNYEAKAQISLRCQGAQWLTDSGWDESWDWRPWSCREAFVGSVRGTGLGENLHSIYENDFLMLAKNVSNTRSLQQPHTCCSHTQRPKKSVAFPFQDLIYFIPNFYTIWEAFRMVCFWRQMAVCAWAGSCRRMMKEIQIRNLEHQKSEYNKEDQVGNNSPQKKTGINPSSTTYST